jgi:hypothetical protein
VGDAPVVRWDVDARRNMSNTDKIRVYSVCHKQIRWSTSESTSGTASSSQHCHDMSHWIEMHFSAALLSPHLSGQTTRADHCPAAAIASGSQSRAVSHVQRLGRIVWYFMIGRYSLSLPEYVKWKHPNCRHLDVWAHWTAIQPESSGDALVLQSSWPSGWLECDLAKLAIRDANTRLRHIWGYMVLRKSWACWVGQAEPINIFIG